MSKLDSTDFSIYSNRCAVSQELMKQTTKELGFVLIRLCAYMEVGNHPDRQTFWEYLEKIASEYRDGQLVLDQVFTEPQNETVMGTTKRILDIHMENR